VAKLFAMLPEIFMLGLARFRPIFRLLQILLVPIFMEDKKELPLSLTLICRSFCGVVTLVEAI